MIKGMLGRRHGGPKLTPAQEREYGKAKAGSLEWVSPAVAAYVLGITTETLKKRRQRGDIPANAVSHDARARVGARYRWSWLTRNGPLGPAAELASEVKELRSKNDQLEADVRHQNAVISELLDILLKSGGSRGLLVEREWSADAQRQLIGLADKVAGKMTRRMSWLDALAAPWATLEVMEPYVLAADQLLDRLLEGLRDSTSAWRDTESVV